MNSLLEKVSLPRDFKELVLAGVIPIQEVSSAHTGNFETFTQLLKETSEPMRELAINNFYAPSASLFKTQKTGFFKPEERVVVPEFFLSFFDKAAQRAQQAAWWGAVESIERLNRNRFVAYKDNALLLHKLSDRLVEIRENGIGYAKGVYVGSENHPGKRQLQSDIFDLISAPFQDDTQMFVRFLTDTIQRGGMLFFLSGSNIHDARTSSFYFRIDPRKSGDSILFYERLAGIIYASNVSHIVPLGDFELRQLSNQGLLSGTIVE